MDAETLKAELKKASFRIKNINITHIADTATPAIPDAFFQILKSQTLQSGHDQVAYYAPILKIDKKKKQAYGYLMTPHTDLQKHLALEDDIEGAMHSFLKNLSAGKADGGDGTSLEHLTFGGHGYVITSVIDTDGNIAKSNGATPRPGGWWFGMQYTNDDVWQKIEKGELKGWSVGGGAQHIPVIDGVELQLTKSGNFELAGNDDDRVARVIAKTLMLIEKDATSFNQEMSIKSVREKMWTIFSALEDSIRSIIDDDNIESKAAAGSITVDQFKTRMVSFLSSFDSLKALQSENDLVNKSNKKGDSEMTTEEMEKLTAAINKSVGDTLAGNNKDVLDRMDKIEKRLEKVEKSEPPAEDKNKPTEPKPNPTKTPEVDNATLDKELEGVKTVDELKDVVGKHLGAISKSLSPVIERLEKAAMPRKGNEQPESSIQKSKDPNAEANAAFAGTSLDISTFGR